MNDASNSEIRKKRIMVIDGSSLLYRAFYALPILTNKKGVYTNAVYGFTNMLLRLLDDYQPYYIGVAFDLKAPTFRHKEYKEYKGTRQKMPEELGPQFELLKELLQEMNIAIFEKEGYEADDILGTFAKYAETQDVEAMLVTGDRDALQLVSDSAKVLITRKGISDIHTFDMSEIHKEYGLLPSQVIDLKGLMGDKSDNIPGVPGVGEKTALKLLHEYGSVENVLSHIDDISGQKLKERLASYKEQALLSKKLATIVKDAPISIDLEECCYDIPHSQELKNFLDELEFHSIIKKISLDTIKTNSTEDMRVEKKIIKVTSEEELEEALGIFANSQVLALLLNNHLTIANDSDKVYQIEAETSLLEGFMKMDSVLERLRSILENPGILKITHDGKGLMVRLSRIGINLKGLSFDTFIAAYLLESTRSKYEVEQLLYDYLKFEVNEADAADLLQLSHEMKKKLESVNMWGLYENVEHPLIDVLTNMEMTGFKVDKETLEKIGKEFTKALERLTDEIYGLAGEEFNINSPKQLGGILFDKLKLPIIKKTKTGYSTDVEVLEKLRFKHKIVEKIIEYRQVAKLSSTYVDGLINVIDPKDGRIHSSFNQTVTATGRISSTEPNLQNIPVRIEMGRRIRQVFVASDSNHVLLDADYSQIELRVLAHISEDPTFIDAFIQNQDIHRRTASEIFGVPLDKVTAEQRSSAKAVNFGIVYGISDFGLSKNLGISRKKAKDFIDSYLARYPRVKEYMEKIVEQGRQQGYVTTLLNRRRDLPELQSHNFNIRSFGERIAMNTPIQGTAADIIKKAMNDVYHELNKRNLESKLILQVHDELILDVLRDELDEVHIMVKELMENAIELKVPLLVEIGTGDNWYEAK